MKKNIILLLALFLTGSHAQACQDSKESTMLQWYAGQKKFEEAVRVTLHDAATIEKPQRKELFVQMHNFIEQNRDVAFTDANKDDVLRECENHLEKLNDFFKRFPMSKHAFNNPENDLKKIKNRLMPTPIASPKPLALSTRIFGGIIAWSELK